FHLNIHRINSKSCKDHEVSRETTVFSETSSNNGDDKQDLDPKNQGKERCSQEKDKGLSISRQGWSRDLEGLREISSGQFRDVIVFRGHHFFKPEPKRTS